MKTKTETVKQRLEYLRGELRAERISYGELHELQDLKAHIEPGDVELLEAAGVPEFPETAQYTPGPWQAVLDPCPTTKNRWLVEKRDGRWKTFIAEVYADPANARLIASAPELLEALTMLLKAIDDLGLEGYAKSKARAAIARATGGEI
jgi:hypothetical protein